MAHLAIDAIGARYGGAAVVAQHAVRAALRNPQVKQVTVFGSIERLRRFSWPVDSRLQVVEPGYPDQNLPARMAWPLVGLRRLVTELGVDRLLCLSNAGIGPLDVPTTVLIQHSLPYSSEALACYGPRSRVRLAAAHWATRASLQRARAVIVQTPTMRATVEQALHLPQDRVHVVPHDPGPVASETLTLRNPKQVLYVGSNSPYKNLNCLAAAISALSDRYPEIQVACTLSADDPHLRDLRWSALGYLSEGALQLRYRSAGVLVMPSLVETVGLPLLEAMRFGLPVVAADRPYAHDVCGDSALFFDPTRPDSLARALERIWNEPAATQARVASGLARVGALHAKRGYDRIVSVALAA
jgi:glycosyltransferase involved in cell wall biosynthesis